MTELSVWRLASGRRLDQGIELAAFVTEPMRRGRAGRSLGIGLLGQLQVHIPQVFQRQGVVRAGRKGRFQRQQGHVHAPLSGVQGGQVVVGFGQLGVVLRQLLQSGLRRGAITLPALDVAEQQAHLRVIGVDRQVSLSRLLGLRPLQVAHHALHIGVGVGMGCSMQPQSQR